MERGRIARSTRSVARRAGVVLAALAVVAALVVLGGCPNELMSTLQESAKRAMYVATPDIAVLHAGSEVDAGGTADAGVFATAAAGDFDVTIANNGDATLRLQPAGAPVALVGDAEFSGLTQPPATIEPGRSVSFTVTVEPSAASVYSTQVRIGSNDPDNPEFTATFTATGTDFPLVSSIHASATAGDYAEKSTSFLVTFSEQIETASVNDSTVVLAQDEPYSVVASTLTAASDLVTINPEADLTPGKRYTVIVPADGVQDVDGHGLYAGAQSYFDVLPIPAKPDPTAPSEGAVGRSVTPTLSWQYASSVPVSSFKVELFRDDQDPASASPHFSETVSEGVASVVVNPALAYGSDYYWRVNAQNSSNAPGWTLGDLRMFTTEPETPQLTSPDDNAVGLSPNSVELKWGDVDGAASYTLYVDDASNFSSPTSFVIDDTMNPPDEYSKQITPANLPGMTDSKTYYFKVRAHDGGGGYRESAVRTFSTIYAPAGLHIDVTGVATTTVVSPSCDFSLDWSPATGAESYRIYLRMSSESYGTYAATSGTNLSDTSVRNTFGALAHGEIYYFKVRALNSSTGAWAESASYEFESAEFFPPDDARVVGESVFDWPNFDPTAILGWQLQIMDQSGTYVTVWDTAQSSRTYALFSETSVDWSKLADDVWVSWHVVSKSKGSTTQPDPAYRFFWDTGITR